ncbi:queuosine biosynthesis protein [Rhizobium phage RHph_Y17]|uniref:Queuosine biosynthesis protein n=2 Tax=Kleczkowskavirus RHEph4 TaxID=1921526 RepID=A0A7S5R201_9CAUD|nr:queuosine biosynthesis protein [Rhizobium phage RHph_Y17]QIG69000.1 queuosine biosynthesis protein [Rhizobium phage RHph_Y3_43]QIG69549.1 queuosine biosynthesis protein [Rhizobium phage RHph_I36]QIG75423.1 queuosine biosynthesis protein [Rhizobium phage RHph_Y1_1]QIG75973.1 queuosine biosynthesis protein [Rhizobium phage RHph_Y2_17_2]
MNNQKPEPRSKSDGFQSLDVHSYFFTIQGEGPFAGHRAIFVRLAGCNLQCPGCDTEYTEGRKEASLFEIETTIDRLAQERNAGTRQLQGPLLVVITGGEPLRQQIGPLVMNLVLAGYVVQVESNGVFEPDPILTRYLVTRQAHTKLVVSPKTNRVHEVCSRLATCFKYVLDHREVAEDGLPIRALQHKAAGGVARPPNPFVPVYLNPFDAGNVEDNKKNLDAVARSCMKFGYIAGVQMHKLMNLE